jgi:uncharacterized protein (TIGR02611 family)
MPDPASEDSLTPAEDFDPPGPDWLYRWRQRFAGESRSRQFVWRLVATTIGSAIVLVGLAMLVLPGPGWVLIFLGLAVLATEYAWAHRLLVFTKDKAQGAASAAISSENRKRTIAITVIVLLLVAAAVSWYVHVNGWSLDRLLGWFGLD